jgi:DNA adenine methylase
VRSELMAKESTVLSTMREDDLDSPSPGRGDAVVLSLPGFEPPRTAPARPFLKWAGGKTRLLRSILTHAPRQFSDYYEPFLGGGAMFFAVHQRVGGQCYLADLNDELMNAWLTVKDRPHDLLVALKAYRGKNAENDYYEIRDTRPDTSVERAAWFIYLNQTAWNGLWRVNRWGVYNVPWGARSFRGLRSTHVHAVSRALRNAVIRHADFRQCLEAPKAGDFVYLDPPYLPISDTSKFSGYTERRFRAVDLAELALVCERLSERGVSWILSNRDNERVRELFSHARIISMTTRRSVAAQNRRDIEPINSPEAIIVGGPQA